MTSLHPMSPFESPLPGFEITEAMAIAHEKAQFWGAILRQCRWCGQSVSESTLRGASQACRWVWNASLT